MFEALCFTLLTACIIEATPQETATPASFLEPRNFNYHPYQVRQYLEETKPTKQGPVLFPNDAPPPPRPPLVVTSRPLVESIARSELNPNPDNSITPSQASPLNPAYPISSPVAYPQDQGSGVAYPQDQNNGQGTGINGDSEARVPAASSYSQVPYADMLKKARINGYDRQNVYNDYEERIASPPIYRALINYANQNSLNQKSTNSKNYQPQNSDYGKQYNKVSDENDNVDYDQNQNYAFSYTVRDQETGDDFSHKQESISGGTNGEYRVRLPDGRIQIVSYTADESGYKADVRYDNENDFVDNYNNPINDNDKNQYNDQKIQNYYVNENFREEVPIKEEPNQYNSKEYYDYSSDYNQNYDYNTKYIYKPVSTPTVSTVTPYTINNLVTATPKPVIIYSDGIISASNNPIVKYETTTDRVVIGEKNLYKNLNNIAPETTPAAQNTFAVTPASYLASTIASLRERLAPKAIISGNFIEKLSKYLTYK